MIAVLAVDPSFGGAQNVKAALSALDDTVLLCTHLDKWRKRPAETIDHHVTKETAKKCAGIVRQAQFIFLIGGSALTVLGKLPGYAEWTKGMRLAAWVTDSYYRANARACIIAFTHLGCEVMFAQPDDTYLKSVPADAVPLFHPISLAVQGEKPDVLTVMHSPGTIHKRKQKGTDVIERVVARLAGKYTFQYRCLIRLPHDECLRQKAAAHIFIDKLPTPHGAVLGKSGLEAMASESAVVCTQSGLDFCKFYFEPPPLFTARDEHTLEETLERLFRMNSRDLLRAGAKSRTWIERYWGLENGAWLEYFRRSAKL